MFQTSENWGKFGKVRWKLGKLWEKWGNFEEKGGKLEPSHLVWPYSSWDSNQGANGRLDVWMCGRGSPLCCSRSLRLAAGSNRKKMDQLRRSHSYCPSRLSRSHLWFWHSLHSSWLLATEHQRRWTPASITSHSPPLLFLSCQSSEGSRQGGLAKWQHLCERGVFKNIESVNLHWWYANIRHFCLFVFLFRNYSEQMSESSQVSKITNKYFVFVIDIKWPVGVISKYTLTQRI